MQAREFPTHIVAASGLVENGRGEVLLVQSRRGDWTWTGGQVEVGESLPQAVLREVMEESGLRVRLGALFAISSNVSTYPGYGGYGMVPTKVMLDFACALESGSLQTQTNETQDARWIAREEALAYLAEPYRARYQAYLRGGGSVTYLAYQTKPAFVLHEGRLIVPGGHGFSLE